MRGIKGERVSVLPNCTSQLYSELMDSYSVIIQTVNPLTHESFKMSTNHFMPI